MLSYTTIARDICGELPVKYSSTFGIGSVIQRVDPLAFNPVQLINWAKIIYPVEGCVCLYFAATTAEPSSFLVEALTSYSVPPPAALVSVPSF
uniref:Uncharacterized protein n=1 Tax=uncultured Lachnospiraceae bacterium TaxID=297314 RepID=A0A3G2C7P7_9FIRM|nr:hypothetical protein [uncultured Lachnospiraceae bacterium]